MRSAIHRACAISSKAKKDFKGNPYLLSSNNYTCRSHLSTLREKQGAVLVVISQSSQTILFPSSLPLYSLLPSSFLFPSLPPSLLPPPLPPPSLLPPSPSLYPSPHPSPLSLSLPPLFPYSLLFTQLERHLAMKGGDCPLAEVECPFKVYGCSFVVCSSTEWSLLNKHCRPDISFRTAH